MPELPTSVVERVGLAVAAELDAIDAELENVSALAMPCRDEFRKQSSERIAQAAINAMPIEALEGALRDAREAIASLPEDALGMGACVVDFHDGREEPYPLGDELLSKIDAALALTSTDKPEVGG